MTFSLKTFDAYPSNFHHFVLATLACLFPRGYTRKRKSATTSLCWATTHSPGITLQSTHVRLSLLVRTKSIWLEYWPLLKVTKWDCLLLKKVLAIIRSKAIAKSKTTSPSWFLLPYPKSPWTASKPTLDVPTWSLRSPPIKSFLLLGTTLIKRSKSS